MYLIPLVRFLNKSFFILLEYTKYFLYKTKKIAEKKANVPSSVNGITFVRPLIEPVSVHIRLHPISAGNNDFRLLWPGPNYLVIYITNARNNLILLYTRKNIIKQLLH